MESRIEGCMESSPGRALLYTLYNIPPVQIAVGIVRVMIATAYLFKHLYYKSAYEFTRNAKSRQREKDIDNSFFTKPLKLMKHQIQSTGEAVASKTIAQVVEKRSAKWVSEAKRGLSEIFLVGALYHTYSDNFSSKRVSVWGIDELEKKIEQEVEEDGYIKEVLDSLGKNYSPWY